MPSFAPGRLAVGSLLVLASAITWGQTTTPSSSGTTTQYVVSVSQASAVLQPQNAFFGSVPAGTATAGVLPLSLKDAIDRALKQNLGLLLASERIPSARGQWWKGLSELLPNLTTSTTESAQQINLETVGINLSALRKIGVNLSPIVGPFGVFDTRAYPVCIQLEIDSTNAL